MRWLIILAVTAAVMFGVNWFFTRPVFQFDTLVETPELLDRLFNQYGGTTSNQLRVTPRVNIDAPESVIRWPAWQSKWVSAVPLELRIGKSQWGHKFPVSDHGIIGPDAVGLRLDWPESDEERAKAPEGEAPPLVLYSRSTGMAIRDLLYSEEYRANSEIKFATPMQAPREESVIVYCGGYGATDCNMRFEYMGRPVELHFPRRRFGEWEEAHERARKLLASIATPIRRK